MALSISYQALDFDLPRVRAFVEFLGRTRADLRPHLGAIVIGDASCSFRIQHAIEACWAAEDAAAFRAWRRAEGLRLAFQLPYVVKESELGTVLAVAERVWEDVDEFVTGDPGVLLELTDRMPARGRRDLVLVANVHNRDAAEVLASRIPLRAIRPLFPKRELIRGPIGRPRELLVYGNLLLNCSIFCFHCGDLPTRCDRSCVRPKHLLLHGERVAMVGRSLLSQDAHLDLVDLLPELPDVASVVIADLDRPFDDLTGAIERIAAI